MRGIVAQPGHARSRHKAGAAWGKALLQAGRINEPSEASGVWALAQRAVRAGPEQANNQKGAISPFMMGLIVGMSIFSVMAMQWAQKELVAQQARNAAQEKAKTDELQKGLEFSVLTETAGTYREDVSVARAASQAAATGKTKGGDEVLEVARETGQDKFGSRHQQVGLTASDDTLFRSKLYHASADELAATGSTAAQTVTTLDVGTVRDTQVKTSEQNMQVLAEQVYGYFAGHLKFPSGSDFDALAEKLNLKDAWGQTFEYTISDDTHATIGFTTPWNYTRTLKISLHDDVDDISATMAAVSGTSVSGTSVSGTTVSGSTVASALNPTSTTPVARY